jgi:hypothetical protein
MNVPEFPSLVKWLILENLDGLALEAMSVTTEHHQLFE